MNSPDSMSAKDLLGPHPSPSAHLSDGDEVGNLTSVSSIRKHKYTASASLSSFAVPSWGNGIGENKGNVRVVVRVRPMSKQELGKGETQILFPHADEDEHKECISLINSDVTISSNGEGSSVADLTAKFDSPFNVPVIPSVITTPTKFSSANPCSTPKYRNVDNSMLVLQNLTGSSSTASFIQPPSPVPSSTSGSIISTQRKMSSSQPSPIPPPSPPCIDTSEECIGTNRVKPLIRSISAGKSSKMFQYDAVIEASATQEDVYSTVVGDAVRLNIYRGYNTTIITYGQKKSGKTFTMYGPNIDGSSCDGSEIIDAEKKSAIGRSQIELGDEEDASMKSHETVPEVKEDGIFPRAIQDLFFAKQRHTTGGDVTFNLTYIELYDDSVYDLLNYKNKQKGCRGSGESLNNSSANDLTSVRLKSAAHANLLMASASKRRKNVRRAHTICTVHVVINPVVKSSVTSAKLASLTSTDVVTAKLILVDLAGSDQLQEISSQAKTQINVNTDLLILERCIIALAEKSRKENSNQLRSQHHVPYRDSKLTRILKNSLGGNCCTVMIACMSPCEKDLEGSLNTLQYSERTRNITNSIKKNVRRLTITPAEGASLRRENLILQSKIAALSSLTGKGDGSSIQSGDDDDDIKSEVQSIQALLRIRVKVETLENKLKSLTSEKATLEEDLAGVKECSIVARQLLAEKERRKRDETHLAKMKEEKEAMDYEQNLLCKKLLGCQKTCELERVSKILLEEKVEKLQLKIEKEEKSKGIRISEIDILQNQMKALAAQNKSLTKDIEGLEDRLTKHEATVRNGKKGNGIEKNENEEKCKLLKKVNKDILQQSVINNSNCIPRCPLSHKTKINNTMRDDASTSSVISVSKLLVDYKSSEYGDSMDQSFHSIVSETDSLSSNQRAIRLHAQKMLSLAERSFENQNIKRSDSSLNSMYSSIGTGSLHGFSSSNRTQTNDEKENTPPRRQFQMSGNGPKIRGSVCTCSKSIFSGSAEHMEFFLPKLGLACKCGAESAPTNSEPAALRTLLRPWQVSFLKSVHIHTANELMLAQDARPKQLVVAMQRWRHTKQMKVARSKSCFIALQIWAKTAQTAWISVQRQQLSGISFPEKPSFLEIRCGVEDDDESLGSLSTLGDDSFREADTSMDNMLLEGEHEI